MPASIEGSQGGTRGKGVIPVRQGLHVSFQDAAGLQEGSDQCICSDAGGRVDPSASREDSNARRNTPIGGSSEQFFGSAELELAEDTDDITKGYPHAEGGSMSSDRLPKLSRAK